MDNAAIVAAMKDFHGQFYSGRVAARNAERAEQNALEAGIELSLDEATELVKKRGKDLRSENASKSGSAPTKKREAPRIDLPAHIRFKPGVPYLTWPKGPVGEVAPTHCRVIWAVERIHEQLVEVFGEQDASAKMEYLTAKKRPSRVTSRQ